MTPKMESRQEKCIFFQEVVKKSVEFAWEMEGTERRFMKVKILPTILPANKFSRNWRQNPLDCE